MDGKEEVCMSQVWVEGGEDGIEGDILKQRGRKEGRRRGPTEERIG